jgi:hypothetical protein
MEQIGGFKARCDLRSKAARGLHVFDPDDVDNAIDMLSNTSSTHPLELNSDLVECCREYQRKTSGKTFQTEGKIGKKRKGELTVNS